MKNRIIYILLVLLPIFALGQQLRSFPYFLPLTGTTKPAEILEGDAINTPTGTKRYTKDGLVLTDDVAKMARSGFALNEIKFGTKFGVVVEFEYAMYGGTSNPGDGFSFFLFDADKPFKLGNTGSALGYSYAINPQGPNYKPGVVNVDGLNGGFLAVGFDAWGNHKLRMTQVNQLLEGIPKDRGDFNNSGKNHVTIRGGANTTNKFGYPVLFTRQSDGSNEGKYSQATRNFNGGYDYVSTPPVAASIFSLRTTKNATTGVVTYNKVKVEVTPISLDVVSISVYVTDLNKTVTIIKDYRYSLSGKSPDYNGNIYTTTTKYPDFFKLGFAAATGTLTQYHVIKNVKINLPFAPETNDDLVNMEISRYGNNIGKKISLNQFSNDAFYKGAVGLSPTKGNDATFIDSKSFQFEDVNGKVLGGVGSDGSAYYFQAGVGNWDYNPATRQVTLTLSEKSYGTDATAKVFSVYYSMKGTANGGGPFNDEYYRSSPTLIKVNATKNNNIEVRLNPNMSIEKK